MATNTVVRDGVVPNAAGTRPDFPYYREPFNASDQVGLHKRNYARGKPAY
jgi:hypothetical protein